MRRKIAAVLTAALLGTGLAAVAVSAPAVAAESTQAEVCYEDETVTVDLWSLQRSDWVAGTEATLAAGWGTESDDAAPTVSDAGLTFTAPGGKAVGVRTASSFSLEELSRVEAPEYTDVFHYRAVLDAVGEPFGEGNWRNDYTSLTFLTADTVWVSGLNVEMTLDAVKAAYDGTITSVGYHMDSNAAVGTSVLLASVDLVTDSVGASYTEWYEVSSGEGDLPDGRAYDEEFQTDALYRYHSTGTREDITQTEVECPVVVVPPVDDPTCSDFASQEDAQNALAEFPGLDGDGDGIACEVADTPALVIPAAPAAEDTGTLASTGLDLTPFAWGAGFLLAIGAALGITALVRRKAATD